MSGHTPGPWILATVPTSVGSCHKIGPFPNGTRAATFACVYADGHRLGIDDASSAPMELAANARLIAAAPDLLAALIAMLKRDERNTCQHDETERGGAIWTICTGCGLKWADDRGGKPEWKDPKEWAMARAAIAKAEGAQS